MEQKRTKEKRGKLARLSVNVTFWLMLSALFAVFFLVIVGREISRFNDYASQAQELRERIYEEHRREHNLNAELHRDNLYEYIERSARERLGLVMPDEIVFIRDRN